MTKKERLLVGKQIREGEISVGQCVEQHEASRETAYRWLRERRISAGLEKPSRRQNPRVSAAVGEGYESMGKPKPIRELMRRDIEVARLKKDTR